MKPSKFGYRNDRKNYKGYDLIEQHQRCEFCNVPIFQNSCSDSRSSDVFKGKGKILCSKCAEIIAKIPAEQALQALNNASETYQKR
jgi:hypothetical protein